MTGSGRQVRPTSIAWLACLLMLAAYVVGSSVHRTTHGFVAYYAAARLLHSGEMGPTIYDDDWFRHYVQTLTRTGVLEIYGPNPPAMALLALPLVGVGHGPARAIWLFTSVVAFGVAVLWLVRTFMKESVFAALILALLMLNPTVVANLRTGQAYLWLFAVFTAVVAAIRSGRERLAGVMLGLAFVLKSAGIGLLLLLAAGRRWRVLGGAIAAAGGAGLITVILAGATVWTAYPPYVVRFVQRPSSSVTAYQTTTGLVRHLCVADPTWNPSSATRCAPPVATLIAAAVLLGAVLAALVVARRDRSLLWIAAGLCTSLLVLPAAEEHHDVILGIPLVLALQGQTHRATWPWLLPLAALLLVPSEWTIQRFTTGWSALAAYPRLYATWLLWAVTITSSRARARDVVSHRAIR